VSDLPAGYWREHGVRIVAGTDLDVNTPQTPGMSRAAAITNARTGARDNIHPPPESGS
jgi:uncharacterized RmlC-like cupin family protein